MEREIATTPFGSRPMSLALMAAQIEAKEIPEGKAADGASAIERRSGKDRRASDVSAMGAFDRRKNVEP